MEHSDYNLHEVTGNKVLRELAPCLIDYKFITPFYAGIVIAMVNSWELINLSTEWVNRAGIVALVGVALNTIRVFVDMAGEGSLNRD